MAALQLEQSLDTTEIPLTRQHIGPEWIYFAYDSDSTIGSEENESNLYSPIVLFTIRGVEVRCNVASQPITLHHNF